MVEWGVSVHVLVEMLLTLCQYLCWSVYFVCFRKPPSRMTYLSYRDAGVDIEAGNSLVKAIQPLAKDTQRSGCDASLGGFGALFDIKAAGLRDPILVSGTDGVGTKLKVRGGHTTSTYIL